MPKITVELIEEALRKEVRKIDKSVQVVAVEQSKKTDFYRVTLIKDGKSGSAELKKDIIEQYLTRNGKGSELKRALGKAVSHLSIRYQR
jgi:nitrogen fixation/metabolism regulation signal transduction histidine kinase